VGKITEKPKIIHLFKSNQDKDEAVKSLEMLIEEIKADNVLNYCVAVELADGTVATGWNKANFIERQNLISHLQIDLMWTMVKVNLDID